MLELRRIAGKDNGIGWSFSEVLRSGLETCTDIASVMNRDCTVGGLVLFSAGFKDSYGLNKVASTAGTYNLSHNLALRPAS
jgi:hypothetical protein